MYLPVDQLYQTNVVVRDLHASARQYAEFYGIERWRVSRRDGLATATGRNAVEGLTFQLVQPETDDGSFAEFLQARGEGVHSICVTLLAPADLPALRDWFASLDVPVAQTLSLGEGVDAVYFDTRAALGGFYVEAVASERDDWQDAMVADEVWDLGAEVTRPARLDFVRETRGLNHYGVVVPDLQAVLPNYARIFGLRRWRGYHWHTGEGSLEDTTYNGAAVEHAFSTARGDVGRDRFGRGFGFEVVQPVAGPTHFQDFLDGAGAGIHHLSLNLSMKDAIEWADFHKWMATLGPVCMQGWLRDHAALYVYSDLSERLGHVVESGIRRRRGHEPDLWYEFPEEE